uniref:Uncharacterized protein n=2 Tax=Nicotiana TaxID=4085 RepID=A0A1S4A5S4_TOBAC|nr:PREDICTED: uncharacterized protein LOC104229319 isoform X1 [Nicotiana sylvestris]XP_016472003.1 PREDICTED: uncharacterized protein LOC107794063 [Nicotiana tabacum]
MTSLKRTFSYMGLQSENLDPLVQRFLETKKLFTEECEMVFSPTDGSHATKILENVRSLGYEGFVRNPGDYVAEIVLEFYTNINKSERTSKIGDPGMISFNGEGISVHPAQGLSMSMVSPPPIVFSERGEVSTAFPMSYTSHPFSEMSPFHDLTTIGSPSNFFNEGLSNPSRCPEFGEINSELQFFQHNGTKTSHTNS